MLTFDAHGDRARLLVGGELHFVAIGQFGRGGGGQRIVFDILDRPRVARDPHVGGLRQRARHHREIGRGGMRTGGEFEHVGVLRKAGHGHRVLPRAHEDHVAVRQVHLRHHPAEQELVEVDPRAHLLAALDLHLDERAAIGIDAARKVEVVQDRIHAGAVIEPRPPDEAAHEHAHRLCIGDAGIAVDIGAISAGDGALDDLLQLVVAHTQHVHGPDRGQEHVAVRIDGLDLVEVVGAPQADHQPVAHADHVFGIELRRRRAGEGAGEHVRPERLRGEVGAVVEQRRPLGHDGGRTNVHRRCLRDALRGRAGQRCRWQRHAAAGGAAAARRGARGRLHARRSHGGGDRRRVHARDHRRHRFGRQRVHLCGGGCRTAKREGEGRGDQSGGGLVQRQGHASCQSKWSRTMETSNMLIPASRKATRVKTKAL